MSKKCGVKINQYWAIDRGEYGFPIVGCVRVYRNNDYSVVEDRLSGQSIPVLSDVFVTHGKCITLKDAEGLLALYSKWKHSDKVIAIMREAIKDTVESVQLSIDLTKGQKEAIQEIFNKAYNEIIGVIEYKGYLSEEEASEE